MKLRNLLLGTAALAVSVAPAAHSSIIDNPAFRVLGVVIVWSGDASDNPVVSDFVINSDRGADGSNDADLITADATAVVTGTLTRVSATPGGDLPFTIDENGTITNAPTDADGFLDATGNFGEFGLTDNTSVGLASSSTLESSFYVASNTAFSINATAAIDTNENFDLSNVSFDLDVGGTPGTAETVGSLSVGGNAQDPLGNFPAFDSLSDLQSQTLVYDGSVSGGRRTAASAGSIASQSVRFDATYGLQTLESVQQFDVNGDPVLDVNGDPVFNTVSNSYDLSAGTGSIETTVTYTVFVP